MAHRWVGVDCGFSKMGIAVLDQNGQVITAMRTYKPEGDGHSRDVALARLHVLLEQMHSFRELPVHIAGYCYDHSGVLEAFAGAGWTIVGSTALNDVVGIYGLTAMQGNVVVGGCGSWPQIIYVDEANTINWPGDDVVTELPEWLLSGHAYAELLDFMARKGKRAGLAWLAREVRQRLGGSLEQCDHRWGSLGPLMSQMLEHPEVRRFLEKAVRAVKETRDVFWRHSMARHAPSVVLGGGAVSDERLWALLRDELQSHGVVVKRVTGEPAVGLARFAQENPKANAWGFIGRKRPAWLT